MKCTVGDIVEFYQQNPDCIGKIKVETRHGFYDIEWADITAYDSPILKIETEDQYLEGSPDHKIFVNNGWKKLKDCQVGDIVLTKTGKKEIRRVSCCEFTEDLYDLQVNTVKEYYTNGIVSHNSTFLCALTFALFGRAYRFINKPRIVNSINDKDCITELEFSVGKQEYKIIRGLKPVVFEIYCDGVLLNQDAKNLDYQKHLEQYILKLNFDSFAQLVVLGSANYVPFMQLTSSQRREVIEELLDLKVFTRMNGVLKEKYSLLREDIKSIESEISSDEGKCKIHEDHIAKLKSRNNKDRQEKIQQIKEAESSNAKLAEEKKALMKVLEEKKESLLPFSKCEDEIKEFTSLRITIGTEGKNITKSIQFYNENDSCPTCKRAIDALFRDETVSSMSKKLEEINSAVTKIDKKIDKTRKNIDAAKQILREIQDISSSISMIDVRISESNNYILKIRNTLDLNIDETIKEEEEKVELLRKNIKDNLAKKEEIMLRKYDYDIIQVLLKDNGIKSKIVKQYLPLMNKYINKYLSAMDFFVNFNLDESFKEKIKSRHRDDFEYNSFSEGEKFRIDMALMLTWREIARAKNSTNTNILILDEVFDSSLDASGTEDFLKLLKHLSVNTHVFVISHKGDILTDKFDRSIRVEKKNNFSKMS
jgi:DNA repair exonuclease SbcCD ATPase subunit